MLRRCLSAAVVAAAASTASLVATSATPAFAASTDSATAVGLLALRWGDLPAASQPGRYDVVVLGQPGDWPKVAALKAAHPGLKVFLYKDVQATSDNQVSHGVDMSPLTTGVGYADAVANHPTWFATDTNGARVPFDDYAGDWWMDVGSRGYQDAWASNVVADVKKFGADGVMMDDVNAAFGYHLPSGRTLAKYPTDAKWAAAQESFLHNVMPQLHQAGVQAIANIMEPWSPTWEPLWKRWVSAVDGVMFEYWSKYGHDSTVPRQGDGDWAWQMQKADDIAAAGRIFFPVTYGATNDLASQTYARASFLLAWDGGAAGQAWSPTNADTDAWSPAAAVSVGQPTGPRTEVAPDVWRRTFSGGIVLVNSSSSQARTVSLDGTYRTSDGTEVTSVRLRPTGATILSTTSTTSRPRTTHRLHAPRIKVRGGLPHLRRTATHIGFAFRTTWSQVHHGRLGHVRHAQTRHHHVGRPSQRNQTLRLTPFDATASRRLS